MSQHDYVIANQTFPNTRTDLNSAFAAIVSQNSGASAPSTTYAYQLWYDTGNDILKMRNADDDAWIDLFTVDQTADTATAPSVAAGSNLLINGNMAVAQRGTSTTGVTSTGYHACDRFKFLYTDAGTWTVSQSTDAPDGFASSFKVECTTAKSSLASNSRLFILQALEGQNLQQLKKGTSSAESITLSFYVRTNKTGTYQVHVEDNDNIRIIGSTYTVSTANTWQKATVTLAGDTTGALDNDNGDSFAVFFALVAGTDNSSGAVPTAWEAKTNADRGAGLNVNLADATSNYWQITGLQMEIGEVATPFEHRSFGDELAACRRYFERIAKSATQLGQSTDANSVIWSGMSRSGNSGANQGMIVYETKRNNPTLSVSSASHLNGIYPISPYASALSSFGVSGTAGLNRAYANANNNASSAPTSDCGSMVNIGNASGYFDIDAEL